MSTLDYASRLRTRWPAENVIARAGVVLGLFAFIVTLPPFSADASWWPVLIGLLEIAAGIWAI
jgi:hypothetical protein